MKNRSSYTSIRQSQRKASLCIEDIEILAAFRTHFEERLKDFRQVPKDKWIREVAFCILTPQSTPFNGERALLHLEEEGLFEGKLRVPEIEAILRTSHHYVRFHKTKAARVAIFLELAAPLEKLLSRRLNPIDERSALSDLLPGFGLKEASHALRNIGRRGLSILDRHILRTLEGYRVIDRIPASIGPQMYLEIERRFASWAREIEEDIDTLDFLFWGKATGIIFK